MTYDSDAYLAVSIVILVYILLCELIPAPVGALKFLPGRLYR